MNYRKTNPVGVDKAIDKLQTIIYDYLMSEWSSTTLDGYGRVYKNDRKEKRVPEYYDSNKEYREILKDDQKEGIFFFNIGDIVDVNGTSSKADCEIIFSVNLTSLEGDSDRDDEQIRQDVLFVLNRNYRSLDSTFTVVTGLERVYSDFSGVSDYFTDMQSFHHFKIKSKINYLNTNCI